eukprot:70853-Chlamydomonas_euryale.AAC.9
MNHQVGGEELAACQGVGELAACQGVGELAACQGVGERITTICQDAGALLGTHTVLRTYGLLKDPPATLTGLHGSKDTDALKTNDLW